MATQDSGTVAVLAEKPSVARDIASVLGATSKGDGYVHGNGYEHRHYCLPCPRAAARATFHADAEGRETQGLNATRPAPLFAGLLPATSWTRTRHAAGEFREQSGERSRNEGPLIKRG